MHCLDCDFDLAGAGPTARCPECGRAFAPDDPTSVLATPAGPWTRRLAAPPGWPMALLGLGLGLLIVRVGFGPGIGVNRMLDALLGAMAAGTFFVLRLGVAEILRIGRPRTWIPRRPLRWLVAPGIVGLAILALHLGLPREADFLLHRAAYARLAAGPPTAINDRIHARLFLAEVRNGRIILGDRVLPRVAILPIANSGYERNDGAWCHAPDAPDRFELNGTTFRRFRGDWFVCPLWTDPARP